MKRLKFKATSKLAIALVLSLLCLPISAFAAEVETEAHLSNVTDRVYLNGVDITVNPEEEISRAVAGITDSVLSAPTIDFSTSIQSFSEANELTLVSKHTTTREIEVPNLVSSLKSDEKIYATTNVAVLSNEKSETNSKTQNYVTAYLTLYWRDNVGMRNDFLGASGGWDVDKNPSTGKVATLSNRVVTLQWVFDASNQGSKNFYPSSNTFNIPESSFDYSTLAFILTSTVKINGSSTLKLTVQTSALS